MLFVLQESKAQKVSKWRKQIDETAKEASGRTSFARELALLPKGNKKPLKGF